MAGLDPLLRQTTRFCQAQPPHQLIYAYAIAFCHNLMSAAIRLGVIGQFDGQRLLAGILPRIRRASGAALGAPLDDLGSATYGADLAAMLHETQITRLFRS